MDPNTFSISKNGKKKTTEIAVRLAENRATKDVIESDLKLNNQKSLVLQCALINQRIIKQAPDCCCFWKDDKKIHAALE